MIIIIIIAEPDRCQQTADPHLWHNLHTSGVRASLLHMQMEGDLFWRGLSGLWDGAAELQFEWITTHEQLNVCKIFRN
jgi:hypothetical protein